MTLKRMDNVLIVVEDLEAAKAFFVELGMELEGEMPVEGRWVDRIVGLENVRCEIAMMRTPDGHGRLELDKFHAPPAVRPEPKNAPVNTLGIRRIMFAGSALSGPKRSQDILRGAHYRATVDCRRRVTRSRKAMPTAMQTSAYTVRYRSKKSIRFGVSVVVAQDVGVEVASW